jgi:hypothetical protein
MPIRWMSILPVPNRVDFWLFVEMEFYNPQRPEIEETVRRKSIGTRREPFPSPDVILAKD